MLRPFYVKYNLEDTSEYQIYISTSDQLIVSFNRTLLFSSPSLKKHLTQELQFMIDTDTLVDYEGLYCLGLNLKPKKNSYVIHPQIKKRKILSTEISDELINLHLEYSELGEITNLNDLPEDLPEDLILLYFFEFNILTRLFQKIYKQYNEYYEAVRLNQIADRDLDINKVFIQGDEIIVFDFGFCSRKVSQKHSWEKRLGTILYQILYKTLPKTTLIDVQLPQNIKFCQQTQYLVKSLLQNSIAWSRLMQLISPSINSHQTSIPLYTNISQLESNLHRINMTNQQFIYPVKQNKSIGNESSSNRSSGNKRKDSRKDLQPIKASTVPANQILKQTLHQNIFGSQIKRRQIVVNENDLSDCSDKRSSHRLVKKQEYSDLNDMYNNDSSLQTRIIKIGDQSYKDHFIKIKQSLSPLRNCHFQYPQQAKSPYNQTIPQQNQYNSTPNQYKYSETPKAQKENSAEINGDSLLVNSFIINKSIKMRSRQPSPLINNQSSINQEQNNGRNTSHSNIEVSVNIQQQQNNYCPPKRPIIKRTNVNYQTDNSNQGSFLESNPLINYEQINKVEDKPIENLEEKNQLTNKLISVNDVDESIQTPELRNSEDAFNKKQKNSLPNQESFDQKLYEKQNSLDIEIKPLIQDVPKKKQNNRESIRMLSQEKRRRNSFQIQTNNFKQPEQLTNDSQIQNRPRNKKIQYEDLSIEDLDNLDQYVDNKKTMAQKQSIASQEVKDSLDDNKGLTIQSQGVEDSNLKSSFATNSDNQTSKQAGKKKKKKKAKKIISPEPSERQDKNKYVQDIIQLIQIQIKKYDIIGKTAASCIKYFKASTNYWIIPLFIVFKRMLYFRITIEQALLQKKNLLNIQSEQWASVIENESFGKFIEQTCYENKVIENELKQILDMVSKMMSKLSATECKKIEIYINQDYSQDIKDVYFIYFYTQIYRTIKNQVQGDPIDDEKRRKENLRFLLNILAAIIISELPFCTDDDKYFVTDTHFKKIDSNNIPILEDYMHELEGKIEELKKRIFKK